MFKRLLKIWLCLLLTSEFCMWVAYRIVTHGMPESESGGLLFRLYALGVLLLCGGALTIFAACSRRVREHALLRFLSFFVMPCALIATEMIPRIGNGGIVPDLPVVVPFLVCLTAACIWFSALVCRDKNRFGSIINPTE